VFLICIWPEKAEQFVAAMKPVRFGDAKKSEKSKTLRLGKERVELTAGGIFEVDCSEGS
jgi:hypothetical protein